jgi:NitT/TauT family transport system permease protein
MRLTSSRNWFLHAVTPWLVLISLYALWSHTVSIARPQSFLLPTPVQLLRSAADCLLANQRNPETPFWSDTAASLWRLLIGVGLTAVISLAIAMLCFANQHARGILHPILVLLSKTPLVATLPVLLIWLGVNETARIGLIVLGTVPLLSLAALELLLRHQSEFGETLRPMGLPLLQSIFLVVLPMAVPRYLTQIQFVLGQAWFYLLVSETFGAQEGLGYRLFLMRRYLAVDLILVYAAWIALLSGLLFLLLEVIKTRIPWNDRV